VTSRGEFAIQSVPAYHALVGHSPNLLSVETDILNSVDYTTRALTAASSRTHERAVLSHESSNRPFFFFTLFISL
jgi:hypothetical protein